LKGPAFQYLSTDAAFMQLAANSPVLLPRQPTQRIVDPS
jgi:hypothetical protein